MSKFSLWQTKQLLKVSNIIDLFLAIQSWFEQPSIIICKQNQVWYKTLYNYNSSYYHSSYSQSKRFVQIKMENFLFTFTQKNLSDFLVEKRVTSKNEWATSKKFHLEVTNNENFPRLSIKLTIPNVKVVQTREMT